MTLDPTTVGLVSGLVTVTVGATFVITALVRRDRGGARLWALAYLLSVTGVVFFAVWAGSPGDTWTAPAALGLSEAAAVAATGCLFLGCRAFTGGNITGPSFLVVALAVLTGGATIVFGPGGVDAPAGTPVLFVTSAALWLALAVAAVAGRLRRLPMAWVLASAALVQAAFSVGRFVVALVRDPAAASADPWFGNTAAGLVAASVGVLVGVCAFVLRAALAGSHRVPQEESVQEILPAAAFAQHLRAVLRRSTERLEGLAVIAVRTQDIDAISIAFGRELALEVRDTLRVATRRFAAPIALVGETDRSTTFFVATMASSQAEARRQAGLLYRGVVQEFMQGPDIVLPGIGIGVALTQTLGYRVQPLLEGALSAAAEASASEETSVVFASVRDVREDPFPVEPA